MQACLCIRCLPCAWQTSSVHRLFKCFPFAERDLVTAVRPSWLVLVWVTYIAAFNFGQPVSMTAGLKAVVYSCRGAGSSDNIEAYVSPGMLQDPWAGLMQQYQQSAPAERPKPLADDKRTLGSAAGHSMSDMFDAVEQVNPPF